MSQINNQPTFWIWLFACKNIWVKVFKNGPSKICGRQSLKKLKWSNVKEDGALPPDVIVVVYWYCRILLCSYVCLFYFTFQFMYSFNWISKLNLFWKLFFTSSCSKLTKLTSSFTKLFFCTVIFFKKNMSNI